MAEERNNRKAELLNKYEFLHHDPIRGELMTFRFECGDGWMPIIEDLFAKIDEEVKRANLTGFKVVQVREKFGGLVIYVDRGNEIIDTLIRTALRKAAKTCEDCGKPGRLREFNEWYSTQCSNCYAVQPALLIRT